MKKIKQIKNWSINKLKN